MLTCNVFIVIFKASDSDFKIFSILISNLVNISNHDQQEQNLFGVLSTL